MYVAVFGLGAFQETGIKHLKKLNYKIVGFDEFPKPKNKKLVDIFFCVSFKKRKKILSICKKYNVSCLFAFSTDAPLKIISYINKKLKLSGYKSSNVNLILNKIKFRNFLQNKMKVKLPKFIFLNNFKEQSFVNKKKIDFPIVCKPEIGSGSRGVFLAENLNDFKRIYSKNKCHYRRKKILIEKFIPGKEYAIDGWINNNNFIYGCLSKKQRTNPPYLLDKNLIINYKNNYLKKKILIFLKKFIKKSTIDNVPIHLEFILFKEKIVPIDIAIRGAGFGVYSNILNEIMEQSTDLILINLLMNKKIQFNKPNNKTFYLNFFYSEKSGIFKKLINVNILKKNRSFVKFELYKKKNSKVSPLKNGSDRIGHFLLMNTPAKLNKDIKHLNRIIKLDIRDE
jgi:hypothetical protein